MAFKVRIISGLAVLVLQIVLMVLTTLAINAAPNDYLLQIALNWAAILKITLLPAIVFGVCYIGWAIWVRSRE